MDGFIWNDTWRAFLDAEEPRAPAARPRQTFPTLSVGLLRISFNNYAGTLKGKIVTYSKCCHWFLSDFSQKITESKESKLQNWKPPMIPGVCSYCWNLTKIFWFSHFVEFVLGRFSHFNIAIAYSNSKFCGAWTPSFCEFTSNFSKTSTPKIIMNYIFGFQLSKIFHLRIMPRTRFEIFWTKFNNPISILTTIKVADVAPLNFPDQIQIQEPVKHHEMYKMWFISIFICSD